MRGTQSIPYFFSNRTCASDRALFYLIGLNIVIGFIFSLINAFDFHYESTVLFTNDPIDWLSINTFFWETIAPSLLFFAYSIYIREEYPKTSVFLWGIGFMPLCLVSNIAIASAVQTTPFSPIDAFLAKLDYLMGIDTPTILAWTHHHPLIHSIFTNAYFSMIIQLFTIPILLTLFCQRKPLTIFYLAQLATISVGVLIYYFLPTMAPSGVFHSPYFTAGQMGTSIHFYELHHYLRNTTNQSESGLIAFPSFHVIWAILLTNAVRHIKPLFYLAIIWNSILITATVFLGWHYLTDVIGGAIIACVGIYFANWVYEKNEV